MIKYNGGNKVGQGTYWSADDGSVVKVKDERVLPGKEKTIYYKIPIVFLLPIGIILGGLYVFFLPLLGLVTAVSVVSKRAFGGVLSQLRKSISFGWRPSEAYLAGKNKKDKNEKRESDQSE